jgi:hypothetical protein
LQRSRTIIASCLVAAFAITAIGAPAAAAPTKTRLIIVNGRAGPAIDVCINGKKKRAGLKYGGKTVQLMSPGTRMLKFFRARSGKCGGQLFAKRMIGEHVDPIDLTVVVTKKFPHKVAVFDSASVNEETDPGDAQFFWRHAADIGKVAWKYAIIERNPVSPSAHVEPWLKGDQEGEHLSSPYRIKVLVTREHKAKRLAQTPFRLHKANQHRESILVGDTLKNMRFVEVVAHARALDLP